MTGEISHAEGGVRERWGFVGLNVIGITLPLALLPEICLLASAKDRSLIWSIYMSS